jgi:hypothetical protein
MIQHDRSGCVVLGADLQTSHASEGQSNVNTEAIHRSENLEF